MENFDCGEDPQIRARVQKIMKEDNTEVRLQHSRGLLSLTYIVKILHSPPRYLAVLAPLSLWLAHHPHFLHKHL